MAVEKLRPKCRSKNKSVRYFPIRPTNRCGTLVRMLFTNWSFRCYSELSHIFHLPTGLLVSTNVAGNQNRCDLVCSQAKVLRTNRLGVVMIWLESFEPNQSKWYSLLCLACCLLVHWMLINFTFKRINSTSRFTHVNWIHNDVKHRNGKYLSVEFHFVDSPSSVMVTATATVTIIKSVITPESNEHKMWAINCARNALSFCESN